MFIEIVGILGISLATATVDEEATLLAQASERVESIRKGDIMLHILNADDQAMPNVQVSVKQTHHDFPFGCNIYAFDGGKTEAERETYRRRFAELFNFATLGFYWRSYESVKGQQQYERTERVLAWCEANGIKAKGHPLVWSNRAGIPDWLPAAPTARMQYAKERVLDLVKRFKGRIDIWDVVNEPIHMRPFDDSTRSEYVHAPVEELVDYVKAALQWADNANSEAILLVNEFNIMSRPDSAERFLMLMRELKKLRAPFRAIGMQAHEPRTDRFPLVNVVKALDRFAELDVPIHITEYIPTSSGQPITGGAIKGTWTEEAQAEYATVFYRICFGHPSVEAITWWDLWDKHSWLKDGGMLRDDLSPKPVYNALKHLIHEEWHTEIETNTDAQGRVSFRGFYGAYNIKVEDTAGNQTETAIRVQKGGENVFRLKL